MLITRISSLVLLLSIGALSQQARLVGSVTGRVIDDNDMPVANVVVYGLSDNAARGGLQPVARTDAEGRFALSDLAPGPNRLFPVLSEQGYPDGRNGVFAGDPSLYKLVEVVAGKVLTDVTVKMPRKGATLSLEVVDSDTRARVLTSRIRITRPDIDWAFYDSSPRLHEPFEIVLPALPFRLEVRAPGYRTWHYSEVDGAGTETSDLLLKSGTTKAIVVELKKVGEADNMGSKGRQNRH